MGKNKRIKGLAIVFSYFLQFVGICMLIKANTVINWAGYFSDTPIDLFGSCSIFVNQFMSGNYFESIFSVL